MSKAKRGEPSYHLQSVVEWVKQTGDQSCFIWPYCKTKGYGRIQWKGKFRNTHAAALMIFDGLDEAPKGKVAAHCPVMCSSPSCINPLHIRWATQAENCADKVISDTHQRGTRNATAKLTEDDVLAIRSDERFQRDIAREYGVCQATIQEIKSGKIWRWL